MAPEEKTPADLLNDVPFHLVFRAEDGADVKTSTISSETLTNKGATPLKDLRTNGNLSPRYRFCFPGDSNTISEEGTTLGSYILSIGKNVTALQNAEAEHTVATLTVSYRSQAAFRLDQQTLSTEPTDMSEHDWNVVMLNNSLLHGMVYDPESKTLQPAREPAFKLKRSHPDRYASPAGTTTLDSDPDGQHHFLAPAFEIADDSSVTFTSVRNSLQLSMIKNTFSSWSVEASLSGGFGGFSGGVNAKGGQSSEDLKKAAMETTTDLVHSSYNFPRVKVFLDGDDLEVSDVCKEFIRTEGRGYDGVQRFYKKFGTIFSCSVVLGARLHSTVESSSCIEVTEETTKEQKTGAVSASFSSPFASGSAGASYANTSEDGKGLKKEDKSGRMNWEARGGTTFLVTEPTAWINTVGMYQNWRVIERHGVRNIFDIGPRLMLFDGMSGILPYMDQMVYLIAGDGRLLQRSPDGAISLIDPNIVKGGNAKWLIVKSDIEIEVTITDLDKVKKLRYDEASVSASASPFSWKVQQASPGSDSFFISGLDSKKKNWIALEADKPASDEVSMKPLNIDSDNQVWRLLFV